MPTPKNLHQKQIEAFVESLRPPAEVRSQLDIGYSFENGNLIIYEIRPAWDDPTKIEHYPFAKTKFIKSSETWKVYWMRANMKWDAYEPKPEVRFLKEFFDLVKEDKFGCFFG